MNDDDLTNDLTRELHDRADTVHGAALGLADVTGRARSIRRRRATTVVVGAAAAVALIVPTAALANHHNAHRTEPLPATQSVNPTPGGHRPAPGVLDVSDLPIGAPPAVAYADGNTIHRPDGSTVVINGDRLADFTTLADGAIVYETASSEGDVQVHELHPDGQLADGPPYPATYGLAVNADRTMAGWTSPNGAVSVWEEPVYANAVSLGQVPGAGDFGIAAITGDDCMKTHPSSVCEVYVNSSDAQGDRQPWEVTPHGETRLTDGSFLSVADQSENGLTIGLDSVSDSGSCSKLLGGGEFQGWSTCKHTLDRFSPDAKLVVAGPAYRSGIGDGVIAMYDAGTGDMLFQRHSSEAVQSFYSVAQWEDDTHVLAPVYQDGSWAIVRIASDGSMEYAVPPVHGDMDHNPFRVETRP